MQHTRTKASRKTCKTFTPEKLEQRQFFDGFSPVADQASTRVDGPVVIAVLNNDSVDPTDPVLQVTIPQQPQNGTAVVNPDMTITYTPNAGYSGVDGLYYGVVTANLGGQIAGITVDVVPPPKANDDIGLANYRTTIDVLANDDHRTIRNFTYAAIDPATVTIVSQPAHGAVDVTIDGKINYSGSSDYVGTDSFSYTVKDRLGNVSNVAKVSVDVGHTIGLTSTGLNTLQFIDSNGTTNTIRVENGDVFVSLFGSVDSYPIIKNTIQVVVGHDLRISDIVPSGTTANTKITIESHGGTGRTTIGNIFVNDGSGVGSIEAPNAVVTGQIVLGEVGELHIAQLLNGSVTLPETGYVEPAINIDDLEGGTFSGWCHITAKHSTGSIVINGGDQQRDINLGRVDHANIQVLTPQPVNFGSLVLNKPSDNYTFSAAQVTDSSLAADDADFLFFNVQSWTGTGSIDVAGNGIRSLSVVKTLATPLHLTSPGDQRSFLYGTLGSAKIGELAADLTATGEIDHLKVVHNLTGTLEMGSWAQSLTVGGSIRQATITAVQPPHLVPLNSRGVPSSGLLIHVRGLIVNCTLNIPAGAQEVFAQRVINSTITGTVETTSNTPPTLQTPPGSTLQSSTIENLVLTAKDGVGLKGSSIVGAYIKHAELQHLDTKHFAYTTGIAAARIGNLGFYVGDKRLNLHEADLASQASISQILEKHKISAGVFQINLI